MPLRREPARALPVPFCRYIFFVVPATSARVFVFDRALPQIGLVHDHGVVQQLLADARGQLGRVDLVRADLGAGAIVNG